MFKPPFVLMRCLPIAVVLALLACACQPDPRIEMASSQQNASLAADGSDDRPAWEPGVVLVKWRDGTAALDAPALAALDLALVRHSPAGVDKLRLLAEETVDQAVIRLAKDPRVVYAEPNHRIELTALPNDPRFSELWGLHNTGQTGGTADADIDAVEAWDISVGSRNVIVAVLDTGVDYTHPDLIDNMWTNPGEVAGNGIDDDGNGYIDDVRGWDFVGAQDNDPMDDNRHGTHCSGTIGGNGNDGLGVVGVNWRVTIMPLRIISNQDLDAFTLDAAEAIIYAADNGARVMSCSWWTVQHYNLTLEQAVGYSDAAGVMMVAAAANEGSDVDGAGMEVWPCEWPFANTICVAATDHNDQLADFSNWGATSVDVSAPGVNILSTVWPGHGYTELNGTSMAAPHVAGTVALMLSIRPDLTPAEIKQTLFATGDSLPALQGITTQGRRINAFQALQAISGVPLPPVAAAGPDQVVATGSLVTLDGSASFDPNQDPITYLWSLTRPQFSSAVLDDPASATPSFVANVCGEYTASLVVTDDGGLVSQPDGVSVNAMDWTVQQPLVQTPHPYTDNMDQTWTINLPGAESIAAHFASFDTESGWDFVYILDGADVEYARYDGPRGEFVSVAVPGETLRVRFTSDGSVTRDGFVIDGTWSCTPPTCPHGFADCNGNPGDACEVNINTDPLNCSGCGTICPNPPNATAGCSAGVCSLGACNWHWDNCNGLDADGCEIDLDTDLANCGNCGLACSYPHGSAACSTGVCQLAACDSGWENCDGQAPNGCEVDRLTDPANCGSCGLVCSYPHGLPECSGGSCLLDSCTAGWGNCDGQSPNGCETDLNTNPSHCSACDAACPNLPHGQPSCSGGACGLDACDAGWGNCDGQIPNGCEIDLNNDPGNCSSCGTVCSYSHASGVCAAGACQLGACQADWGDCDGQAANGCEAGLQDDSANCGVCGTVCSFPNSQALCQLGECRLINCLDGYANCDHVQANGCEVDLTGDPQNCAVCGQVCDLPNAATICQAGACVIDACDSGWDSCDGVTLTGCEIHVASDLNHCGACGETCGPFPNATPVCAAGSCGLTCDAGFADCNGQPDDGCEAQMGTATDCGACGDACSFANAAAACDNGVCQLQACDAGWADCNGGPGDGCETQLGTDSNCLECGDACNFAHANGSCQAGVCQLGACNDGWGDCDAQPANGCEASLRDDQNCGACAVECTSPESCLDLGAGYVCSADCQDVDADGHADQSCGGDDCLDTDAAVHPGADEICDDGVDNDCNGLSDADDPVCPDDGDGGVGDGGLGGDGDDGGGKGCSCSAGGASSGRALLGLLGLLALAGWRRRRN